MRMTYMRLLESRFFYDQHFILLSVSRGSRERKFALMARQLPCLAALSVSNPRSPEGRAGRREGLTAKSARRGTIVSDHYAANVTALTQGGAPLLCGARRINLYPAGASPRTKVPHATCEGTGLQGGWDPSATRLLSASHAHGHTSTFGIGHVPFAFFQ